MRWREGKSLVFPLAPIRLHQTLVESGIQPQGAGWRKAAHFLLFIDTFMPLKGASARVDLL